jgi:hypothetical protein
MSRNRCHTADVLAQYAAERSFAGCCRNGQRTTDEAFLEPNCIGSVWMLVYSTSLGLLTMQVGGVEIRMENLEVGINRPR